MPVEALETALYTKLSTTAALITELGGTAIYSKMAPQGVGANYVVFQYQGGGDDNKTTQRARNLIYTIFGVAKTQAKAAAIDGEIDTALHNQSLTVSGWTNYWLAREDDINLIELDAGGVATYRVGGQYRIRMEDT